MKILKEHENLQNTGGYTIIEKRKNSNWLYIKYWGIYGSNELKIKREELKEELSIK